MAPISRNSSNRYTRDLPARLRRGLNRLLDAPHARGEVTQETSITTGVTLNYESGQISTVAATLAAGAEATFTVSSAKVGANDFVLAHIASTSSAGTPVVFVTAVAAGSFDITLSNLHASAALDAAIVIRYLVLPGNN